MAASKDRRAIVQPNPGDWVEVLPYEQIAATLDADGKLEGVPFMPEMVPYCGRRLRVSHRAVKTCAVKDRTAIRGLHGAVHLEGVRCDGAAHGGCQAACLLFWKDAWLRPVEGPDATREPAGPAPNAPTEPGLVTSLTGTDGETIHVCQATELWDATCHLPWFDPSQYVRDVRAGGTTVLGIARGFAGAAWSRFEKQRRRRYGRPGKTPSERLDLHAGEWVVVKSRAEIDATLDAQGHNRGLWWDPQMYAHCGKRLRVMRSLGRVIDESTGRMRLLREPTVILDDVVCSGAYHRFCSRSAYVYWREVWLRRVPATTGFQTTRPQEQVGASRRPVIA